MRLDDLTKEKYRQKKKRVLRIQTLRGKPKENSEEEWKVVTNKEGGLNQRMWYSENLTFYQ